MTKRNSGILLHPVSLPGPYGIGDLGDDAYRFADWLQRTGQTLWQVLPLGPTGAGDSPYMCYSAFAGNPLLISADVLYRRGWLPKEHLPSVVDHSKDRVAYSHVHGSKQRMLEHAFAEFSRQDGLADPAFTAFRQRHAFWLEDYALFMALKSRFDDLPWNQWPQDVATADADAMTRARKDCATACRFHEFVQFVFFDQWQALRNYCAAQGVRMIGDLPLYVAFDSSDVWANRELFQLDRNNQPTAVAGVPPDYFSASGQRWGNPLYRWQRMAEQDYRWWTERFRVNFELISCLRLDHFRGYEAYWEVPIDDLDTTRHGNWVQGPGAKFFHAIERSLQRASIEYEFIAEDLGVITPEVDELRDDLGYPGMRILQMAFGDDPKASEYLPHNHIRHCAAYTATHDHNTTKGWFTVEPGTQTVQSRAAVEQERARALAYIGSDGHEIHWDMIRLALGSVADTAVIPLQDVLGLDSTARMNLPGTTRGNWEWRFRWEALNAEVSARLSSLTALYQRNG